MKKHILIAAITAAILISGLCLMASRPMISHKKDVPVPYLDAIEHQAKGVYSTRLPLLPVYVSVERFSERTVFYTIHYFPFGSVGMSYTEDDGYNIEKPLTGH